jgi:hypothetical protein
MAAKKKKKAASKKKAVKAKKKAPARKAAKKSTRKTKKTKKATAKKAVKAAARKAPAKKAKKKTVKKKQIVGEGDYAATRKFDSDQATFVAKNKANIPAMGKDAEKALDGPEGDSLRDAEATAAGRSRDAF